MNARRYLRRVWPLVLLLAAVGVFVVARPPAARESTGAILQSAGPAFDPIRADEILSVLPEDAIHAINDPIHVSAGDVTDFKDNEPVIGVAINGEARAFPLATLSAHEIVNDVIGGKSVAVTW